jgi:hypothetical protein
VTSPRRIDVWFDETVDEVSATDTSLWSVVDETGAEIPVLGAMRGGRGDRVTLELELPTRCLPRTFTVRPGALLDATPGGAPHELDVDDPGNVASVTLERELTITLGGSGRENVTVPVLDAGLAGAASPLTSHDEIVLHPGATPTRGFVRFVWRDAFVEATGIRDPSRLLAATLEVRAVSGAARPVQLRRVLQPWTEATSFGDADPVSTFGPTWYQHEPGRTWNVPGASALGGTGEPADYEGEFDLASRVESTAEPTGLDAPLRFEGLVGAYRLWLDRPELSWGFALELESESPGPMRLRSAEHAAGAEGPVLRLTYSVPELGVRSAGTDCAPADAPALPRAGLEGPRTQPVRPGPRRSGLDRRQQLGGGSGDGWN